MIPTDDALMQRIVDALIAKWAMHPEVPSVALDYGQNRRDAINSVIRTTVADVCLILEGSVPIEAYEARDLRTMGQVWDND